MHEENTNTCAFQETDNSRRKKRKVGKLDILDTLDVGFGILRNRYKEFFIIQALVCLPICLLGRLLFYILVMKIGVPTSNVVLATYIIIPIATILINGAQINIAVYEYLGQRDRSTVKESFKVIARRSLTLILVEFLKVFGFSIGFFLLIKSHSPLGNTRSPSFIIGFFLLIATGIWFLLLTILTQPIVIFEGKGPIYSIRRSMKLTQGNRLRLLGVWFLAGIIIKVVNALLEIIAQRLQALWANFDSISTWLYDIGDGIIGIIPIILPTSLVAVVVVVTYFKLRDIAEGFDLEKAVDALNYDATESSKSEDHLFNLFSTNSCC